MYVGLHREGIGWISRKLSMLMTSLYAVPCFGGHCSSMMIWRATRQTITWTNSDLYVDGTIRSKPCGIWIKIIINNFKRMHIVKLFSTNCRRCHSSRWIILTRSITSSFDVFLICARTNGWANSRGGDLRRHYTHWDVTVMQDIVDTDESWFTTKSNNSCTANQFKCLYFKRYIDLYFSSYTLNNSRDMGYLHCPKSS